MHRLDDRTDMKPVHKSVFNNSNKNIFDILQLQIECFWQIECRPDNHYWLLDCGLWKRFLDMARRLLRRIREKFCINRILYTSKNTLNNKDEAESDATARTTEDVLRFPEE